jgi:hypothetical protein
MSNGSVIQCAQCGAAIITPEWSGHLSDDRVRNVWSCEDCGYEFEYTIHLSVADVTRQQIRRRFRRFG